MGKHILMLSVLLYISHNCTGNIRSLIWSEAFCLHVFMGGGVQDFLFGSLRGLYIA
jgi:hypothetical protein